jgi:hypothetical protein
MDTAGMCAYKANKRIFCLQCENPLRHSPSAVCAIVANYTCRSMDVLNFKCLQPNAGMVGLLKLRPLQLPSI